MCAGVSMWIKHRQKSISMSPKPTDFACLPFSVRKRRGRIAVAIVGSVVFCRLLVFATWSSSCCDPRSRLSLADPRAFPNRKAEAPAAPTSSSACCGPRNTAGSVKDGWDEKKR